MEPIGSDVPVKQEETVETTTQATHFNVLQFLVKPPSHEVLVEVCLMDADGNAVGPARWMQLNPLMGEEEEVDNWLVLLDMTLREINAKVKARLQGMSFES